jgi:hypothetical protein
MKRMLNRPPYTPRLMVVSFILIFIMIMSPRFAIDLV